MSGARILHAQQRDNIARHRLIEFFARIGVHFDDSADALSLARKRIEDRIALGDRSGINARERQRTKAVVHDLERERAQRRVRIYDGLAAGFIAFEIDLRLRVDFRWIRQDSRQPRSAQAECPCS